jgi:predicted DsbA family dithiol-disulfide isomerase
VEAEAVDAVEFGELAQLYQVMGVPKTVFNRRVHVDGAVPEQMFLKGLLQAAGGPPAD